MISRVVTQVVRRFRRAGVGFVAPDELWQEGYKIALAAVMNPNLDPTGNVAGYIHTAVSRSLGNYVSKQVAVPSFHGHWEEARNHQVRVDPDEVALTCEAKTPEESVLQRESTRAHLRLRVLLRRMLMRHMEEQEVEIVDRLYGLDGWPAAEKPNAAAAQLGIPVRQVYRAASRLKRVAGSLDAYRLGRSYRNP